jgi:hypothetical protein
MNYSTASAVPHSERRTKTPTKRPRKSFICDSDFIHDLWVSGYFARFDGRDPSVSKKPLNLNRSSPHEARHTPKPWESTGEELRGLFYHAAILSHGNVRGFTLRLSKAVEIDARGRGKHCLAWLHERVVRELRRAVGASEATPTPFWFSAEEDNKGALHIHGVIAFDPAHVKPIRKGLTTAGGKWIGKGRERQLRFSVGRPNFGWAGYSLKDARNAQPERRRFMRRLGIAADRRLARFEGKAVTASEGLKRAAIGLHGGASSGC